ncbi:agmatinase [Bosea vaviloviae]|uniref:Agmatinase n=1 Tax=Bosea vaviloviae TaxID=1526658 RepID=A0A1D7U3L0_9HYPH|nr:agmatinase [Bosea vaviloviae]AOO81956.1 agmatinase [Bosea vaviloviae]
MTEPADTPTIDHAFTGDRRGAAHDPTYAGALSFMRRRYSKDFTGCDLVIWGVPFDLAVSNRPGTRFGPQALRRVSAIFDGDAQYPSRIDPFEHLSAVDYGDCLLPRSDLQGCAKAIEEGAAKIIASGAHLVTLGGDHFITLPLLRAHVARHGKLALVQFDAHQDTWDDGIGAISHGTFVLEAVREGLIDVERSIQIGIRTVAPRDCGIAVIDGYAAQALGVDGVVARIRQRVGHGPAYLTFDIDGLDPAFAPGTGTPVAGGLSSAQGLGMVWGIRDLDFRGMDVVEVSPPYDHADATAIAGAAVAQHYIQALALKKMG